MPSTVVFNHPERVWVAECTPQRNDLNNAVGGSNVCLEGLSFLGNLSALTTELKTKSYSENFNRLPQDTGSSLKQCSQ